MNHRFDTRQRERILIFSLTPSAREPRVLKQVALLKREYSVTTAGFGPAPDEEVDHIQLDPSPQSRNALSVPGVYSALLLLRQFHWLSRLMPRNAAAFGALSGREWDLILAHDVATVPVAMRLRPRCGVIVDLHEYATRQGEHSRRWLRVDGAYARWVIQRRVPHAAGVSTVGQGIAEEYAREFGIHAQVVANATPHRDLDPTPADLPLRLVHSGLAAETRKLEVMIEAVQQTRTPVTLDLYLVGNPNDPYLERLKALARGDNRIVFRSPVPYEELVDTLAHYDIGLSVIAPTTFNLLWCLPNKFFDYVQARLAIITGPSPEMARITEKWGLGVVTEAFTSTSLARTIDGLTTTQVNEWKANANRHSHELSSETQVEGWRRMVVAALGQEDRRASA